MKRLGQAAVIVVSIGIIAFVSMTCKAASEKAQVKTEEVEQDTEYAIGSVSKLFTATAIMQLVEKGKIDLDKPVTTYLPEFKMADERYKQITVRMLLEHSSGLMGTTFTNNILYEDNDTDAHDHLLERLSVQRLKAKPGAYSTYCNDGFEIAELIVEKISGESFTEYLNNHIFTPLGMKNSGTPINKLKSQGQVTTYFNDETTYAADYCNVIGPGGIISTAEDLSRFGTNFFKGADSLLTDTSLQEMSLPVTMRNSYGYIGKGSADEYGLGWDSVAAYPFSEYGITALVKGGDVLQQHGMLMVLPDEKISVAVNSSGGSSIFNELLAQELATLALEEKGTDLSERKEKVSSAHLEEIPENYLKYAGTYANNRGIYSVSFPDNKYLKLEACDADVPKTQYYYYTKNNTFVTKDYGYINNTGMTEPSLLESGNTTLSFMIEKDGKQFICMDTILNYAEMGKSKLSGMFAQKIEPVPIEDSVLKAWENRNGKRYYLISEKYSSGFWKIEPMIKLELSTQIRGYINAYGNMNTCKVVNNHEAKAYLTLTGGAGRDLSDISLKENKDGEIVCLENLGRSYIEECQIPDLALSIQSIELKKREAKWYHIGKEAQGQSVTLNISDKMAVYVYNQYDKCIYSSYMKNRGNKVTLPENGKLAVIGEAGTKLMIDK